MDASVLAISTIQCYLNGMICIPTVITSSYSLTTEIASLRAPYAVFETRVVLKKRDPAQVFEPMLIIKID